MPPPTFDIHHTIPYSTLEPTPTHTNTMAPLTKSLTPIRALLQYPATLRPTLTTSPLRPYHSYETPQTPPYAATEHAILSSALLHVPNTGFTQRTLRQGATDAGYLEASANLFPRGEFELVLYHLKTQRLGLGERIRVPEEEAFVGVGRKVRALVMQRLRGNAEAGVLGRWQEVCMI